MQRDITRQAACNNNKNNNRTECADWINEKSAAEAVIAFQDKSLESIAEADGKQRNIYEDNGNSKW